MFGVGTTAVFLHQPRVKTADGSELTFDQLGRKEGRMEEWETEEDAFSVGICVARFSITFFFWVRCLDKFTYCGSGVHLEDGG